MAPRSGRAVLRGVSARVMNYLCFANSKVLFRQLRMVPATHAPVANLRACVAHRICVTRALCESARARSR